MRVPMISDAYFSRARDIVGHATWNAGGHIYLNIGEGWRGLAISQYFNYR